MTNHRILIVDDEANMRRILSELLTEQGYEVAAAKDGAEAIRRATDSRFDLIILDLKLPDVDGITVLRELKKRGLTAAVVVLTAFSSIETAIEAMKLGAYDYIPKPFKVDKLKDVIKNAIAASSDPSWGVAFPRRSYRDQDPGIIGKTPAMRQVLELVDQLASTNATVLIYGESGTGKELVARAIHYRGPRASRPLIKVSCAALPESLLESELFGHEKGAFTNAIARRPGRFELADTGTLFLDEVGEMSPAMQSKLLRVLQEHEFERVGGTKSIKVDVRVIAATNKDLRKEVAEGRFREDLYYRLSVVPIYLPPLRERKDDIPLLCERFIERFSREIGKTVRGVTDEAMQMLRAYDWPGNVRELENCIERAVIFTRSEYIGPDVLFLNSPAVNVAGNMPASHSSGASMVGDLALMSLEDMERMHIIEVLKRTNRNRTEAAKILKITRRTLLNKIKEYGIRD
ncbi:MAG TPA: sigma-54-dependent Fis family transcriptional regulator [Firmicutes bacterium]|nr:sigma-54-dependent Fis family transcriptional regulator [Bacillota bacterium]